MRPKGSAAELERRWRGAIVLLEQGIKPAKVAQAVGTSRASVTRWRQAYEVRGDKALASKPHPGGTCRLTPAQRRRLVRLLLQGGSKPVWRQAVLDRVAAAVRPGSQPGGARVEPHEVRRPGQLCSGRRAGPGARVQDVDRPDPRASRVVAVVLSCG